MIPYIFHKDSCFTMVDYNPKSGVFCQKCSGHLSKSVTVAPYGTKAFTCFQDSNNQLYIASMPNNYQLNLHYLEGSHFNKRSLISNSTSNYYIKDPVLYPIDNSIYITYVSHQKDSSVYNFVQENIDSPNLNILYSLNFAPEKVKFLSASLNTTYIFFIVHDDKYHLYALEINRKSTVLIKYLTSPVPIADYSICCHNNVIYIAYVAELHGKYQLCCFNNESKFITSILTCISPCSPAIFYYCNCVFINILYENELKVMLSMDNCKSFSMAVRSFMQTNIHKCHFFTYDFMHLSASEMYFALTSTIKLATVSAADIYNFHNDSGLPPELLLLIEGLSIKAFSNDTVSSGASSDGTFKNRHTNSKQDVEAAKKAFMNELNGWDMPPRI